MSTRELLETFLGLQRAVKRKAYESDSDSDIDHSTNRGNKLKHHARFVRQGQLGAADGLTVFTETVEHAGYRREILSRNRPLVDDDGYEIDTEEDDEAVVQGAEADAAAVGETPYAEVHLEQLLAPLTAVTDLPTHPTLSRPFTNTALSELATQGCSWMHKENAALWQVKPLLVKFCGDHIWVDSRLLVRPDDAELFDDDAMARRLAGELAGELASPPAGAETTEADAAGARDKDEAPKAHEHGSGEPNGERALIPASVETDGADTTMEDARDARTALVPVPSSPPLSDLDVIHPLYLAPRSAHPEPNLGLPEGEAEDVRRLLQLWVQKQEEVSRGARKLHEGLLRADRLRKTVLRWAKAEAHSGPNRDMSDNEDWYDREEWGLAEDLKKGHDEEEEDTTQTHKKTRNRK